VECDDVPMGMKRAMKKFRFGRKRLSYALPQTVRLARASTSRVNVDNLDRLGGMGYVTSRFGLLKSTILRVWESVRQHFEAGLDANKLCDMETSEVFLILLQCLFQGPNLVSLSLDWGISHTSIGSLINHAMPALRASICSTHIWPPPPQSIPSKYNRTLDKHVLGAIDCRYQVRNRVHPGQAIFYRGDQGKHGLSV